MELAELKSLMERIAVALEKIAAVEPEANEATRSKREAGRLGGLKSAAVRKAKYGTAVPVNRPKIESRVVPPTLQCDEGIDGPVIKAPEGTIVTSTPPRQDESILGDSGPLSFDFNKASLLPPDRPVKTQTHLFNGSIEANEAPAKQVPKQPAKLVEGSALWKVYEEVFFARYGTLPIRNAKINTQCRNLVREYGLELGSKMIRHYLGNGDAWDMHHRHPLGRVIMIGHKLAVDVQTGLSSNLRTLRKEEDMRSNDEVVKGYALKQEQER